MRFLVDAQLPPGLARWISAQGHDVAHVSDLGMTEASDLSIWRHAVDTGAVVVTKDEDFVVLAHLQPPSAQVVWVRYGNLRKAELLGRIAGAWPEINDALTRGESLVELV